MQKIFLSIFLFLLFIPLFYLLRFTLQESKKIERNGLLYFFYDYININLNLAGIEIFVLLISTVFFPSLRESFLLKHFAVFHGAVSGLCFLKRRLHDFFYYFQNKGPEKIRLFKNAFLINNLIFIFFAPLFFKSLYSLIIGHCLIELFWGMITLKTQNSSSFSQEGERKILTSFYYFYPLYSLFIFNRFTSENGVEILKQIALIENFYSVLYLALFSSYVMFIEKKSFKNLLSRPTNLKV